MPKYVQLLVEGELDEQVLRRVLDYVGGFEVSLCLGKHGISFIEQHIARYNQAANHFPCICLIDLDTHPCVVERRNELLPPDEVSPGMMIRVAVRMVEAWLLADRENIAKFLGVARDKLPPYPEQVEHPKKLIVELARKSTRRDIRQDLVPGINSAARYGGGYVAQMQKFVLTTWNVAAARQQAPSLNRMLIALERFRTDTT